MTNLLWLNNLCTTVPAAVSVSADSWGAAQLCLFTVTSHSLYGHDTDLLQRTYSHLKVSYLFTYIYFTLHSAANVVSRNRLYDWKTEFMNVRKRQ